MNVSERFPVVLAVLLCLAGISSTNANTVPPDKPDSAMSLTKHKTVILKNLLKDAPVSTRYQDLAIFEQALRSMAGHYRIRPEIERLQLLRGFESGQSVYGVHGEIFYLAEKNVYYIQHDPVGASTLHYYGPFKGNPKELDFQLATQREKSIEWSAPDNIEALRHAIKQGSPEEKEQALEKFTSEKIMELIPDVVDAITDVTALPRHQDTGWGFVGHQAASSLAMIAGTIDGLDPRDRGINKCSFPDMYFGGQKLKENGRLEEVQSYWRVWWKKTQAQTAKLVEANNEFATDLYAELSVAKEGNIFFSPHSIHTALAMTYAGAKDKTAKQIAATLHYDKLAPDLFHPTYGQLLSQIAPPEDKPSYELHDANALWLQKGEPFLDSFLDLNRANYKAGLFEVDYAGNTETARQTINKWVEDQTKDKIKELIKPPALTRETVLVLTNAIYFKGVWESPFAEKLTKKEVFSIGADETIRVAMMKKTADFGYFEAENLQALQMPYRGGDLSMLILLPKKIDGLSDLEKQLSAANLNAWLGKLNHVEVQVFLPKFKTTSEFELNEALQKMGMVDSFAGGLADFSGINGRRDLVISKIIHQAYVDVNEQGTEAAAATAVIVGRTAFVEAKVFKADHPFIFMIRHDKTGAILFMGRIVDPTK